MVRAQAHCGEDYRGQVQRDEREDRLEVEGQACTLHPDPELDQDDKLNDYVFDNRYKHQV